MQQWPNCITSARTTPRQGKRHRPRRSPHRLLRRPGRPEIHEGNAILLPHRGYQSGMWHHCDKYVLYDHIPGYRTFNRNRLSHCRHQLIPWNHLWWDFAQPRAQLQTGHEYRDVNYGHVVTGCGYSRFTWVQECVVGMFDGILVHILSIHGQYYLAIRERNNTDGVRFSYFLLCLLVDHSAYVLHH